ncbi:MAG: hypothetical protein NC318_07050 [Blautia sp.]|nr:hypothetical protein [Lachnoclostridium sp.]MCM1211343.1 hypothetical protein [Blautia sp.]
MGEKIKGKGLFGFLEEDTSLKEKISYEEFQGKKAVPDNSDETIEKAYQDYCTLTEKI